MYQTGDMSGQTTGIYIVYAKVGSRPPTSGQMGHNWVCTGSPPYWLTLVYLPWLPPRVGVYSIKTYLPISSQSQEEKKINEFLFLLPDRYHCCRLAPCFIMIKTFICGWQVSEGTALSFLSRCPVLPYQLPLIKETVCFENEDKDDRGTVGWSPVQTAWPPPSDWLALLVPWDARVHRLPVGGSHTHLSALT